MCVQYHNKIFRLDEKDSDGFRNTEISNKFSVNKFLLELSSFKCQLHIMKTKLKMLKNKNGTKKKKPFSSYRSNKTYSCAINISLLDPKEKNLSLENKIFCQKTKNM